MTQTKEPKTQTQESKNQFTQVSHYFGLIFFLLIVLIVWNIFLTTGLVNAGKYIDGLEAQIKIESERLITFPNLDDLIKIDPSYSLDCSEWYSVCQDLVFDNQSGYFITRGYIDPTCEGMCAYRTLHKKQKLREVNMSDLLAGRK